jgi:hypothetical protein
LKGPALSFITRNRRLPTSEGTTVEDELVRRRFEDLPAVEDSPVEDSAVKDSAQVNPAQASPVQPSPAVEGPALESSAGSDVLVDDPIGNTSDDVDPADVDAADVDAAEEPVWTPAARSVPARVRSGLLTTLAVLLVAFAIFAPDDLSNLTVGSFARIPVEAMLIFAVVLMVPGRLSRVVATLIGIGLGLLTIIQLIDMGFFATLSRPFNLVLDWAFLPDALEFLTTSVGRVGATGVVIGIVLLAIALPILMSLSMLRLSRLAGAHTTTSTGAVAVLAVTWITCAVLGARIVPGQPVAAKAAVHLAFDRAGRVRAGLHDHAVFAKEAANDPFADTPGSQLLTGLRGKSVMLAFIESYGRTAVLDPGFAPQVDAALDAGTKELNAAGYASRSGWLTSPTAGGGSVLAHATLQSGLWINNRQRYKNLTASNRLSLNQAFDKADWRTVGLMPGITHAWPEGTYYHFDKIYGEKDLGYKGPAFGWATMPDEYTLQQFQRIMHAQQSQTPQMTEVPLLSSHIPWAPLPTTIPWDQVGDGSVYNAQRAAGKSAADVWSDKDQVKIEYRNSIVYTLNTLISYVQTYGDKNLVLIFLGDHQPVPLVTGKHASRDVPITIVAKDPAVLKQVDSWGWQDGLRPDAAAPVWRMDQFRNKFLTAFGSTPRPAQHS